MSFGATAQKPGAVITSPEETQKLVGGDTKEKKSITEKIRKVGLKLKESTKGKVETFAEKLEKARDKASDQVFKSGLKWAAAGLAIDATMVGLAEAAASGNVTANQIFYEVGRTLGPVPFIASVVLAAYGVGKMRGASQLAKKLDELEELRKGHEEDTKQK